MYLYLYLAFFLSSSTIILIVRALLRNEIIALFAIVLAIFVQYKIIVVRFIIRYLIL